MARPRKNIKLMKNGAYFKVYYWDERMDQHVYAGSISEEEILQHTLQKQRR